MWFSRAAEPKPSEDTKVFDTVVPEAIRRSQQYQTFSGSITALPRDVLALASFAVGVTCTVAGATVIRRYFRRIPSSGWVTPNLLKKKAWIKGRVISVGDADGFRLYHMPGFGWRWPLKFRRVPFKTKGLDIHTISVRMAGIDAPEGGHFGKEKQPHYDESKKWLTDKINGKIIYCQLIRKDQYGRVVAVPHMKPRFLPGTVFTGENICLSMLRAGWAVVYEQSAAVYGSVAKAEFMAIQEEAKSARRGLWRDGDTFETPSEYKRRHAAAAAVPGADEAVELDESAGEGEASEYAGVTKQRRGLWSMLFRR
ncbi:hypothetical protein BC835DRAFT_1283776 [Cytidiella melzeri]|nr:hypothetical protein BC835DRAFT_1283776 [Cytidiella melzeri]